MTIGNEVIYFVDGVAINQHTLVLACGFLKAPDATTSRLLLKFGDAWGAHTVPNDFIVSVCFSKQTQTLYALGKNGVVKSVGSPSKAFTPENIRGKFREQRIDDANERGPLTKIAAIGKSVWACGWGGQIYRLTDGENWIHFEDGLPTEQRIDFLDIDGSSDENIFAVGMHGVICHFNGNRWHITDSPTNVNLHAVHCSDASNFYIAGQMGFVHRRSGSGWQQLEDDSRTGNFWDLESFGADLYATLGTEDLLKFDGNNFVKVDMQLKIKPITNHITAADGVLWSIGPQHLVLFDGNTWDIIPCPENE